MKLRITDEAKKKLEDMKDPSRPIIRLYYDTEGCGCGVNGLPTIRFTDQILKTDNLVVNAEYKVIIDNQQATFFKPDMKLDFIKNSFRLSSPDGILNPIISPKDVKEGEAV
ncbi:MAG: iron-sulfur cluster biosynthesis family protein [Halobacillus sp.]|uniref:iron-sulfur cluster biosynthesis family protein n=1 Tax=Halobacillus sp. TaxID=56800 RepID=UPI003BB154A3